MSLLAWQRAPFALLLSLGVGLGSGCEKHKPVQGGGIRIAKRNAPIDVIKKTVVASTTPAPASPALSAAGPPAAISDNMVPDLRYQEVVLPIFLRHGCFSGPCHSATRGGGFQFLSAEKSDVRPYKEVLLRIDRKDPANSELLQKSTRKVPHNGGRNLSEDSCDYKRLLAWIGSKPDVNCSDDPPPDPARFAREVAPALSQLGCVSCHNESEKARAKFDLSPLAHTPMQPERAQQIVDATHPSQFMTWANRIIKAANAEDGTHTAKLDKRSCAYRRVYGYLANAPELTCTLDTPAQPNKSAESMPDFARFVDNVLPGIAKRGCFDSSCHGGGAGGMSLYGKTDHGSNGWHEYLMLTARVEDFAQLDKSTFLTTVRNQSVHGGGERLGGKGDCIDQAVTSWLSRTPDKPCAPPPVPTFERFVRDVQPVLDKMTCTQAKCHGESLPKYVISRFPKTMEALKANYQATLAKIDLEFMPFSEVQLRMREPCAYTVVGAWITNGPQPSCEVHEPDPRIFPKVVEAHTKARPGMPL